MKSSDDDGSILVLGIGLSLVCVLVATVAINVATVWLARTALDSIADGAALAGAQAIDSAAIYRDGLSGITHVSPNLARTKVRTYLSRPEVKAQVHGLKLRSVAVSGNAVQVAVSCVPAMPFGYLWDTPTVIARSKARAINYVK
jgi:hypothetical protein